MISEKKRLPKLAIVAIRNDRKIYINDLFKLLPNIIFGNYNRKRLTKKDEQSSSLIKHHHQHLQLVLHAVHFLE